jgi:hypothetical protein
MIEAAALRKQIQIHVNVLWRARARGNLLKVEKQRRKIRELKRTLTEFEEAEVREPCHGQK